MFGLWKGNEMALYGKEFFNSHSIGRNMGVIWTD